MSFLAPLFLLGAAAIALPILFHLIRQTTRERTVFSSLFLLEPTPPRLTRRSRLNNILLLILRCLVLGLLAFGFARPFLARPISEAMTPGGPGRVLVLIDTSASMRRAGHWEEARKQALAQVRKASPADQLAIYTYDREIRPVLSFSEWSETAPAQRLSLAEGRIGSLSPGWAGSRAGASLQEGAELLTDAGRNQTGGRTELVLISDLQEGSRFETIQGYEWPKDVRLTVAAVSPKRIGNAALQLVGEPAATDTQTAPPVKFRVTNSGDSRTEQFKVGWMAPTGDRFAGPLQEIYVPAGQARTFSIAAPAPTNRTTRLVLQGDTELYDNTAYVVQREPARSSIVYVGRDAARQSRAREAGNAEGGGPAGDDPKAPLYFLRRAFSGTTVMETTITATDPAKSLDPAKLQEASLLVATDLEENGNIAVLRRAVEAGKTLFVSIGDARTADPLARLLQVPIVELVEVKVPNFAMLAEIDFRHPLFAPFADPRFADFSKVRFWTYFRMDASQIPGGRVLARFDGGDPALLEADAGRGKIVILCAGWQPDQSQLALSTKFVPLLHTLLEHSGEARPAQAELVVGDALPIPTSSDPANVTITAPAGPARTVPAAGHTNLTALTPGIYEVLVGKTTARFAVNLDPAESRPGSIALEDLERMGAPVQAGPQPSAAEIVSRQMRLKNAELENRQKLWRYLVLGALGVLFVETWLSGRTTRRILLQGTST